MKKKKNKAPTFSEMISKTFKIIKDYKNHYILIILFCLLAALFSALAPYFLGYATDSLYESIKTGTGFNYAYIVKVLAIVLSCYIIDAVCTYFKSYMSSKLGQEIGYDFKIEQAAANLSGGQKQRMSIARALLSGGECLLFDDSFSAVDYITDKRIRNSINKNYSDKMVILVTQRVGTIKDADKIIVIDEGKIESIGNYETLEKSSKVFKEFIDSQKREVA